VFDSVAFLQLLKMAEFCLFREKSEKLANKLGLGTGKQYLSNHFDRTRIHRSLITPAKAGVLTRFPCQQTLWHKTRCFSAAMLKCQLPLA
jgi:hypothetical protein